MEEEKGIRAGKVAAGFSGVVNNGLVLLERPQRL
jgi:hypothetical protein